jgi:phage tail sheath gpL-like
MGIDASVVARVLGIDTKYQDMRAGELLFLPQRVAVLAQGASDAVYSSNKYLALSAGDVGARFGYGSPAHLALLQLLPINGDGVDTIPVTVYPLQQLAGATAASGDVTPSGTQTQAATYRFKAANVKSAPFVIPQGASVSYILGAMMVAIQAVLEMPVTVTPAYGTVTSTPGGSNVGNGTITALSVVGAARPGAYKLTLVSAVANGGVFKLTDPDGNVVSSAVTMAPGVGGTTVITIAGIQFTITDGTTDFALADSFTLNVPATKLNVVSRWKGDSANAITLAIEGTSYGVTFAFTQPTGGAGNPDVTSALAQMGNVWETLIVNCLNESDTNALQAINTFGEGRWGSTFRKPLMSFCGQTAAEVADATAISSTRPTDRINGHIPSPGSADLPLVVAARGIAKLAKTANNSPSRDYGSQQLTGLTPGPDGVQWDFTHRDAAVKLGSSTVEVVDGIVCLSDVVTYYRPTGEMPPAYRYACDIVKLQNIIFNVALEFQNPDWDGASLVPNDQVTVTRDARKPKDVIAAANGIIDSAGKQAFISDPKSSKKKTTCVIDSQNPKRFDLAIRVQLSGNANVKDTTLFFGFYFGAAAG